MMSKTRTLNILKTTTPKRVWNLFKLRFSYFVSSRFGRNWHWGKPAAISIEPTTICNLRCPQCPSGLRSFSRATGSLDLAMNRKILDETGDQLQYINYYFQGEPFVNRSFLDLVKEARMRNIYTVTSTNAHFITPKIAEDIIESGLSEIIISIDGLTQETYEKYRINGKLEKVLTGTRHLIDAKKRLNAKNPVVVFQFLVVRYNEHQMDDLKKLANEMGVDIVRFKTVQIYDYEQGNDLLPDNPEFSRYRKEDNGEFTLKNAYKNKCWRMWSGCVFTWDGNIVPCCFDKDATHEMGKLQQQPFIEIWKGAIYQKFRSTVFKDRKSIEICKNCSEGSKIWV